MKILVIADQDLKIDKSYISNVLKEEVTLNSVSQDGVSIFECGTPIPQEEWDWIGLVGTCNAPMEIEPEVEIPLSDDPVGNLITALAAVLENMDVDESESEAV